MPTSLVLLGQVLEETDKASSLALTLARLPSGHSCFILRRSWTSIVLHGLVTKESGQCLGLLTRLNVLLVLCPFGQGGNVCCFARESLVASCVGIAGKDR